MCPTFRGLFPFLSLSLSFLSLSHCGLSSKHVRMSRHDVQNKILNKTHTVESSRKSGRVCYLCSGTTYINLPSDVNDVDKGMKCVTGCYNGDLCEVIV